eukprot:5618109-Heterocapsa_arctica.AAC.1
MTEVSSASGRPWGAEALILRAESADCSYEELANSGCRQWESLDSKLGSALAKMRRRSAQNREHSGAWRAGGGDRD